MFARILGPALGLILVVGTSGCVSSRGVLHMGEQPRAVERNPAPAAPSHLISWNVHKAEDERFTSEMEDLLANIPEEDGVILCLQEVRCSTFDLIRNLHREDVRGHYAPSWRFPFARRSTGVLTLGNWLRPVTEVERVDAPRREGFVASPKVALRTEVPVAAEGRLEVINCHGLNFVTRPVYERQLDEAFAALGGRGQPAIVCGDFNVWSPARLALLREKARQEGFIEADAGVPARSPVARWLRFLKPLNGFDPDLPLDRVFTRGVEVLECYYVNGSRSSDHLPLVVRFRLDSAGRR